MWLRVLPDFLIFMMVLIAPGLAIGSAFGLRGLSAWTLSPLLSVALIAIASIIISASGRRWSVTLLVLSTLAAVVVAHLADRGLRHNGMVIRQADRRAVLGHGLMGTALGAAFAAAAVIHGMRTPDALSQSPDVPFHLSTIRWMVDSGDLSALHASSWAHHGAGFYPAAFHDFVATVLMVHEMPVVTAANLGALALAALIWPLGCVLLARQVFGPRPLALIGAGLLSSSFVAFPTFLLSWGVLWPNAFGEALVPAVAALILALILPRADDSFGRARAGMLLVVAVPTLAIAHPSALFGVCVLALSMLITRLALEAAGAKDRRTRVRTAAAALALPLLVLLVLIALPRLIPRIAAVAAFGWEPTASVATATVNILMNDPKSYSPLWVVSALTLVGAVSIMTRRRHIAWAVLAFGLFATLYVLATAVGSSASFLTGYWYNDAVRLAAAIPVVGVILALEGLTTVRDGTQVLYRRVRARTQLGANDQDRSRIVLPAAIVIGFILLTGGNDHGAQVEVLANYYHPEQTSRHFTDRHQADALIRLAKKIPPGSIVVGDPSNGTSLLYGLTGRQVLFPDVKNHTLLKGDQLIIGRGLSAAAQSPEVCAAVRRQGVGYLMIRKPTFWTARGSRADYTGVQSVRGKQGFDKVAAAGGYTLYRITACEPRQ